MDAAGGDGDRVAGGRGARGAASRASVSDARPEGPPFATGVQEAVRVHAAVQVSVAVGATLSTRIVSVRRAD